MRIYDLSLPLQEGMSVWPGDPTFRLERWSMLQANGANVSRLELGTHTGTHVDAPAHLLPQGATVDALPWEALLGPAWVVELPQAGIITATDLQTLPWPAKCRRVLFKTQNSCRDARPQTAFPTDYVALAPDAAAWLVAQGVLLVGLDAPSVDPWEEGAGAAHRILLEAGVVIVEGLQLSQVPSGVYELICLPLRILGGDGAPARAILMAP